MVDNCGFRYIEQQFKPIYGKSWVSMAMRFKWCMSQYPIPKEINDIFDDVLGHH